MIVHTAVRKKVPLKKKVRSGNSKKPTKSKNPHSSAKQKATKDIPSSQVPSIKPVQTIVTASGATSANTTTVVTSNPPQVPAKRNMIDNSRKLLKKKKRTAPNTPNENPKQDDFVKPTKKYSKKSKLKQEIIDYSARTENHTNTFGKVQKWLMDNPLVTNTPAPAQINHTTHVGKIISKSQSTPEGFVASTPQNPQQQTHLQRSPKKAKIKTKSVGNINEKVKLQVVYKPPFKFSLKLSKNENNVKTQVVSGARNKNTRKGRIGDLKRVGVTNNSREEPTSPKGPNQKRRSAILIRSAIDPVPTSPPELHKTTEPTYETLTPKSKEVSSPAYENLQLVNKSPNTSITPPINTATFRISKSASGGAILMPSVSTTTTTPTSNNPTSPLQNIPKNIPTASQHSFNKYVHQSSSKGSSINNLSQINGGHSRRASLSNNLAKQNFGGSSQNLMRSSTTNLTKANRNSFHIKPQNYELSRSSTTNLTKEHHGHRHHGSHANLRRGSTDDLPGNLKTFCKRSFL